PVLLDDLVCDGKSKPRTFPHFLGGKERVEYLRLDALGNASAVVDDIDRDMVLAMHARYDGYCAVVVRRRLNGIRDQVEKDLVELRRRATDRCRTGIELLDLSRLDDTLGELQRTFQAFIDRAFRYATAVEPAEILQIDDDLGDFVDAVNAVPQQT